MTSFSFELTISKRLSNIIIHCNYIGAIKLSGIHKLTLVGAACQLTEEVHQVEETGRTPACGQTTGRIKNMTITQLTEE